jgi:hypothetical protein
MLIWIDDDHRFAIDHLAERRVASRPIEDRSAMNLRLAVQRFTRLSAAKGIITLRKVAESRCPLRVSGNDIRATY